ncbi:MAG: hypothetical protein Q7W45_00290 [Bacteroidota bacterium]|nr:hypothetical protein [Bacteroidota bacterium]MDP3146155.1 hypothetical protein [Bacteroidota bacterium]MDP3556692.1 hypothetical protein [Bacteroidota bacterium]
MLLSSVKVKGVRLWSLVNENVISEGGQTKLMFNDLENFKPDDKTIFVIGSSHAYRGYDPRIFKSAGIKLFNMGTSGQNMKDSYTLIKTNKSKIHSLIVDIYPGVLQEVTEESTLMLIQNANENQSALEFLKNNITINSINNMTSRLFDLNPMPLPYQENYIYNGYVEKDIYFKIDTNLSYNKFIPGGNYKYLDSLLNFASNNHIKTWLASHPLKWNASYKNYYQNSYLPQVQKILSKYPDIVFFDFTLNHSNSDSLFSDASHLNQKGVNFYNKKLIEQIKSKN